VEQKYNVLLMIYDWIIDIFNVNRTLLFHKKLEKENKDFLTLVFIYVIISSSERSLLKGIT